MCAQSGMVSQPRPPISQHHLCASGPPPRFAFPLWALSIYTASHHEDLICAGSSLWFYCYPQICIIECCGFLDMFVMLLATSFGFGT